MRRVFFLALLFISGMMLIIHSPSLKAEEDVLFLGDSHVVGDFGKFLHNSLTTNYPSKKILTIGIGGARAFYFKDIMKNFCCGSIVRKGENGKSMDLETFGSKTLNQIILNKSYQGNLNNVLKDSSFKFTTLVLNLGSNFYNKSDSDTKDYIFLINKILTSSTIDKIIWITPFQRIGLDQRMEMVQKVIDHIKTHKNVEIILVRSDVPELIEKGIGGQKINSTHYWRDQAQVWSNYVFRKLKELLN